MHEFASMVTTAASHVTSLKKIAGENCFKE
jgi:hypothetical protein